MDFRTGISFDTSCAASHESFLYDAPAPILSLAEAAWSVFRSFSPALQSWSIAMLVFHSLCFAFELCDRMRILRQYKIFLPTQQTPTYADMLPTVLRNQTFILLPIMLAYEHFELTHSVPNPVIKQDNYGTFVGLLNGAGCCVLAAALHEIMFYITHRYILHTRWGFHVLDHRLHHQSRAHSAVSAMYMSAPDFLLEIVLPYMLPLAVVSRLTGPTLTTALLPLGTLGGLYEHSGYQFFSWTILDTTAHGLHHRHIFCSFADGVGATNTLDYWFGTACSGLFGISKLLTHTPTAREHEFHPR